MLKLKLDDDGDDDGNDDDDGKKSELGCESVPGPLY